MEGKDGGSGQLISTICVTINHSQGTEAVLPGNILDRAGSEAGGEARSQVFQNFKQKTSHTSSVSPGSE
ncbi:hypothetical protein AMELA_G00022490 [Ameiurus melas]|uniref:Uncharacterized protein n=1 Tax=Ameiurus melas TaxID=219545 RepID=A0A7J6BBZ1_AMEME|nr:hypothetical protein AMELA_G00022490 [Ameiurus melas]